MATMSSVKKNHKLIHLKTALTKQVKVSLNLAQLCPSLVPLFMHGSTKIDIRNYGEELFQVNFFLFFV